MSDAGQLGQLGQDFLYRPTCACKGYMETGVQPVQAVHGLTEAEIDAILREKKREAEAARYQANRDTFRARRRQRYADNRDAICAAWRERYASDAEFREAEKAKARRTRT